MSNTQLIIYGTICVVGSIPFYVSLFTANNHNGDPQLAAKKQIRIIVTAPLIPFAFAICAVHYLLNL